MEINDKNISISTFQIFQIFQGTLLRFTDAMGRKGKV